MENYILTLNEKKHRLLSEKKELINKQQDVSKINSIIRKIQEMLIMLENIKISDVEILFCNILDENLKKEEKIINLLDENKSLKERKESKINLNSFLCLF